MWGVFAGITMWVIVYPMFLEWRQRQLDRRHLANMRRHFSLKHRWDSIAGSMDGRLTLVKLGLKAKLDRRVRFMLAFFSILQRSQIRYEQCKTNAVNH